MGLKENVKCLAVPRMPFGVRKGAGKSRVGPKDFEAALYPFVQREVPKEQPANCWEVAVGPEDARLLALSMAARFAYDALEHFASEQPELGQPFVEDLLVIALVDEGLAPGKISARASLLSELDRSSRKARAFVLGEGVVDGREPFSEAPLRIITDGINPQLYEEKGRSMGFISFVKALQRKAEGSSSEPVNRRLNPVSLIQYTIEEIEANAMVWPDGKDFPHRITVYLSQADYAYYGPNRRANEQRLEDEILLYAQECGASLERDPRVCIKVDPLLYCGQMRVESSFDEGAARPASASAGARAGVPTDARTSARPNARAGARVDAPVDASCITPAFGSRTADAMRTPEYDPRRHGDANAMAKLTSAFFQSAVLPNDTVGRMRYGESRPAPSIKLDGPEFEFVSHEQGSFAWDRNGWSFTSLGRNGTSVQRKGSWLKLEHGKPFPLEDGDGISFGKCAPLTFSVVQ